MDSFFVIYYSIMMNSNTGAADNSTYSTVTSNHSDNKRKVSILADHPPTTNAYDNLGYESHPSRKISQVNQISQVQTNMYLTNLKHIVGSRKWNVCNFLAFFILEWSRSTIQEKEHPSQSTDTWATGSAVAASTKSRLNQFRDDHTAAWNQLDSALRSAVTVEWWVGIEEIWIKF